VSSFTIFYEILIHISLTRYPPKLMYDIIADARLYSLFVPYCTASTVTSVDPTTKRPSKIELKVGFGSFEESFESLVTYTDTAVIVSSSKIIRSALTRPRHPTVTYLTNCTPNGM
jgi:ribosome-associated toxin RatA of RatAB toxin-antitoxin module